MKKTFFIFMTTVLSVFMNAAVVSADGKCFNKFHGVYAMAGKANGLISPCGFNPSGPDVGLPPYVAVTGEDCQAWGAADTATGTWTFRRDGSGEARGMNYALDFPPGPAQARQNEFWFAFDYTITCDGRIDLWVTEPNGDPPEEADLTMLEMEGRISKDRKIMTLINYNTFLSPTVIFNGSRVLIRIKKEAQED
jgi:hypothetical protein